MNAELDMHSLLNISHSHKIVSPKYTREITGFIDRVTAPHIASNNGEVMTIVLNNNHGKRIQVNAWGKLIKVLQKEAELENVIQIEGGVAKFVSYNSQYNDGNINLQIEIKGHTTITKLGTFAIPLTNANTIQETTFATILNTKGIIAIEGAVKNSFRSLKSKYQSIGLGSITDGVNNLEVRITNFEEEELNSYSFIIHKGHTVKVTGELVKRTNGPSFISVKSMKDISVTPATKKSFTYLLNGFNSM